MPKLVIILICMLFAIDSHASCTQTKEFIDYSLAKYCDTAKITFVLIDGSDALSAESRSWISTNVFGDKNLTHFNDRGGKFSVSVLKDSGVANMEVNSVCSPTPMSKINLFTEAPNKVKAANKKYDCAIDYLRDTSLGQSFGARKSLIIEAIEEIFTSPKYEMKEVDGPRKFILVSDLFQNSSVLNFHKLCTKYDRVISACQNCPKSKIKSTACPTYNQIIGHKSGVGKYLKTATPKLRTSDEVYIYNTNVRGRVDESAHDFWRGFFIEAGVDENNIIIQSELVHH